MKTIERIIRTNNTGDISQYIHGDLRNELAPFVLFDAVHAKNVEETWGFGWHPHSGVATLTYIYGAQLHHQDTSSGSGVINSGGFQWMQAGNGIWHKEFYKPVNEKVEAHQLWVQLPPIIEDSPASYIDRQENEIPLVDEKVRVVAGEYNGVSAGSKFPVELTYLDIHLEENEEIEIELPTKQVRGFVFPRQGVIEIQGNEINSQELAKLNEKSTGKLLIKAKEESRFIIAATEPSPYSLIASRGQIHTNAESLDKARNKIIELQSQIK